MCIHIPRPSQCTLSLFKYPGKIASKSKMPLMIVINRHSTGLLCLHDAYYFWTMSTVPAMAVLRLYYACTMPTPVLCILYQFSTTIKISQCLFGSQRYFTLRVARTLILDQSLQFSSPNFSLWFWPLKTLIFFNID